MWLAKLVGYDFTIKYKPGHENKVANSLSRLHETKEKKITLSELDTFFAISTPLPRWLQEIKDESKISNYIQQYKLKVHITTLVLAR